MFISKRGKRRGEGRLVNFMGDPVHRDEREELIPGHPGPRREGEADAGTRRREREGRAVCSWVRFVCVECQLIMSLLLTPYVEFFMLSLTSLLNTDKF